MCTTFGCPRVGNHEFKKRYRLAVPATFAFVHAADVITKLPPATFLSQAYASVGTMILISACGNLVIDPSSLELAMLHQGYSSRAHSMSSYAHALLMWCVRSHGNSYTPHFWHQTLLCLRRMFDHEPEVRHFLRLSASAIRTPRRENAAESTTSLSDRPASLEGIDPKRVAHLLKTCLDREHGHFELEDDDAHWRPFKLVVRYARRIRSGSHFSTDDAIRILTQEIPLKSEEMALDIGQTLLLGGFIVVDGAVFARRRQFQFTTLSRWSPPEESDSAEMAAAAALNDEVGGLDDGAGGSGDGDAVEEEEVQLQLDVTSYDSARVMEHDPQAEDAPSTPSAPSAQPEGGNTDEALN
ncbi:hypothetical protein PINS_up003754 [Pythium insidiosum]|nr:hypothetical protein PINS_up003754 [Pythium insidiosum]